MQRQAWAISAAVLVTAFALSGCGGSAHTEPASIGFNSPAVTGNVLPARYTCDGQNTWPPMDWGSVPSGTRELAVMLLGLVPSPSSGRYKTIVEWAMAGVNPALHKIDAGELPAGAHLSVADSGGTVQYSICPRKGQGGRYQFAIYAIPSSITIPARFVGSKLFDVIANPESKYLAAGGGSFIADYTRATGTGGSARARGNSG